MMTAVASSSDRPYVQSIPRELLRIGVYLLLLGVTGALVAVAACVAASLLRGKFFLPIELLGMAFFWGLGWGALAIAPMWHRPLLAGWLAVTLPSCALAGVVGFVAGVELGSVIGILFVPVVAVIAHRRLPITFPRYPPGQCPACGYELHNLRSRRCPECGVDVLGVPPPPPPPPQ
jgi:hypothetical protein